MRKNALVLDINSESEIEQNYPIRINSQINISFEVIERFSLKNGISLSESIELHENLLIFLDNSYSTQSKNHPSKIIDEVWHQFILHTKEYMLFSIQRYGIYIHHKPLSMKFNKYSNVVSLINEEKTMGKLINEKVCEPGDPDGCCPEFDTLICTFESCTFESCTFESCIMETDHPELADDKNCQQGLKSSNDDCSNDEPASCPDYDKLDINIIYQTTR